MSYIVGENREGNWLTRFHKHIVSSTAIPGTRTGFNVTLECGHMVHTFGDLSVAGGVVLCLQCREKEASQS